MSGHRGREEQWQGADSRLGLPSRPDPGDGREPPGADPLYQDRPQGEPEGRRGRRKCGDRIQAGEGEGPGEADTTRTIEESDEDKQRPAGEPCAALRGSRAVDCPGKKDHQQTDGCGVALKDLVADGDEVTVMLGRESASRLDLSGAGKITLEVQFGGGPRRIWPLVQIDPGLRRLNDSGGLLKFGDGASAQEAAPVTARLLGCEGSVLMRNLAPGSQNLGTSPLSTKRLSQSERARAEG